MKNRIEQSNSKHNQRKKRTIIFFYLKKRAKQSCHWPSRRHVLFFLSRYLNRKKYEIEFNNKFVLIKMYFYFKKVLLLRHFFTINSFAISISCVPGNKNLFYLRLKKGHVGRYIQYCMGARQGLFS